MREVVVAFKEIEKKKMKEGWFLVSLIFLVAASICKKAAS